VQFTINVLIFSCIREVLIREYRANYWFLFTKFEWLDDREN